MKKMIMVMAVCAVAAFCIALGIEFTLKRGENVREGAVTRPAPVPARLAPNTAGTAAVSHAVEEEADAPAEYEYEPKTGKKEYLR